MRDYTHQNKPNEKDNRTNAKKVTFRDRMSEFFHTFSNERTILSIIFIEMLLITLSRDYTLPVAKWWFYSDPVVLLVVGIIILMAVDNENKVLPIILCISQIAYDFYPVYNAACFNHCNGLPIILLLSFGIPIFTLLITIFVTVFVVRYI